MARFEVLKAKMTVYFRPFLNWKFLISFGSAWFVTNGWSYLLLGFGTYFGIKWMISVSSTYIAFLYFPFTPEKLITLPIAIFLQMHLFSKDKKLHEELIRMQYEAKCDFRNSFKKVISRKEMKKIGE